MEDALYGCRAKQHLWSNDNFDPQNGHVVSAPISKFHKAKQDSLARVTLWGSGKVKREFLYCDDVADAVINLADLDWDVALDDDFFNEPVNIGAELVLGPRTGWNGASVVGYEGEIDWDTSMPDGFPSKLLDGSKMTKMGWQPCLPTVSPVPMNGTAKACL